MSIESILTPPGTANRVNQDNRNSQFASGVAGLGTSLIPGIQNQINFSNSLEPGRQSAIRNAMLLAQPGTQAALADKSVGQINTNLADTISNLKNQYSSAGLSAGALAGGIGDATNAATEAKNAATTAQFDPAVKLKLQEQLAGLASQGQQSPQAGLLAQLGSLIYGQPATHVGTGLGDILGGALGQWAGGGFKTGGK